MEEYNEDYNGLAATTKLAKDNNDRFNIDTEASIVLDSTAETKKTESPSKVSRLCKKLTFSIVPISDFSGETTANSIDYAKSSLDNDTYIVKKTIKISILVLPDEKNNATGNNIKSQDIIHSVMLNIDDSLNAQNVIKLSIDQLNDLFEEKKEEYRLSLSYGNYKLKPSKRNGKPNNDYPAIDKDSSVKDTGIINFSLMYIDGDLLTVQKKECCSKCFIF
jgi:hypothetical protein